MNAPAKNWQRVEHATKDIGPVLLRDGPSALDPPYVGSQAADGRWFCEEQETYPTNYCLIPPFDSDDDGFDDDNEGDATAA